jgi:hypothetical protein
MTSDLELDRVDRATLRAWSWLNVAGWSLLALAAGIGLHVLVDAVVTTTLQPCCSVGPLTIVAVPGDEAATAGQFLLRAGLSLAVGATIGALAGRKVWKRPVAAAVVVALGYAALAALLVGVDGGGSVGIISMETAPDGSTETVRRTVGGPGFLYGYQLLIALTIPAAAWTSRRRHVRRV